jgi:signal transduction histidine kinase
MDHVREALRAEDDERRALERALHDGPLQDLVAIAMSLQPLPDADESHDLVHAVLAELRALATRLYPALLGTNGLSAALRMAAAGAPVRTTIVDTVPEEVAVTVYRCALAAHPQSIDVHAHGGSLAFEIRGEVSALVQLVPRVVALGGTLDVGPGLARGRLPLSSRPGT